MVLVALSKRKLDNMLSMCYSYSCRWRYEYNASKCAVVVFNETKHQFQRTDRVWFLGNERVIESESYLHLGITCNKYLTNKDNVKQICSKIKCTYLSLVNSGIQADGLHPLTSNKIYKTVVLPKALYGSEMLYNVSNSDILSMEQCHRFCIKFMQRFPSRTRTAVALGMLGQNSLISDIDKRKLVLFGQLCRLSTKYRVKEIFNVRLVSYLVNSASQIVFIAEIINLVNKYNLRHVVDEYLRTGVFISKYSWKRLIKLRTQNKERESRNEYVNDPVYRFYDINPSNKASIVWEMCKLYPCITETCYVVAYLTAKLFNTYPYFCSTCQLMFTNFVEHALCECPCNRHSRNKFYKHISDNFSQSLYQYITNSDIHTRVNILLGAVTDLLCSYLDSESLFRFQKYCFFLCQMSVGKFQIYK